MDANVRVVRISDDKVLYNHTFTHKSEDKKTCTDWAENYGLPFKDGLDRCLDNLARQVVTAIFGLQTP